MTKTDGYGRNAGKRWRYEDLKTLRQLARSGASVRLISLRLGRPDSAIIAKAESLNLKINTAEAQIAPPPTRTLKRSYIQGLSNHPNPIQATKQGDLFAALSV
jgi:hypothetical protein